MPELRRSPGWFAGASGMSAVRRLVKKPALFSGERKETDSPHDTLLSVHHIPILPVG